MGRNETVKHRLTMFIPGHIYIRLEAEAMRRLKESGQLGYKTVVPVIRDILMLCADRSLAEIIRLDSQEFEAMLRGVKSR